MTSHRAAFKDRQSDRFPQSWFVGASAKSSGSFIMLAVVWYDELLRRLHAR